MRFKRTETERTGRGERERNAKTKRDGKRRRDRTPPHHTLQRTLGNQAVQNLVESETLQAKLETGRLVDPADREGEQVAEAVIRMDERSIDFPAGNSDGGGGISDKQDIGSVRRVPVSQSEGSDTISKEAKSTWSDVRDGVSSTSATRLNSQAGGGLLRPADRGEKIESNGQIAPDLSRAIQRRRGGGRRLPEPLRNDAESAFSADFSDVRVYTDEHADTLAQDLQAKAFTMGSDIFFSKGTYDPSGHKNRRLLGHELMHTLQQSKVSGAPIRVSDPDDASERDADRAGRVFAELTLGKPGNQPSTVLTNLPDLMPVVGEIRRDKIQRNEEITERDTTESTLDPIDLWVTADTKIEVGGQKIKPHIRGTPRWEDADVSEEDLRGEVSVGRETNLKANVTNPQKVLESSVAAVSGGGSLSMSGLRFRVDFKALESKFESTSKPRANIVDVAVRIEGTIPHAQLERLLGIEVTGETSNGRMVWDIHGGVTLEIGVNIEDLRGYVRRLDRIDERMRALDRAERERPRHLQRRNELDRRLKNLRNEQRRAGRIKDPRRKQAELTRIRNQWERVAAERNKAARAAREPDRIRAQIRQYGREANHYRRRMDKGQRLGRQLRRGIATRAIGRLGGRLLAKLIPIVNIASIGYDIYTIGRLIIGILTGRISLNGDGAGGDGEETNGHDAQDAGGDGGTGSTPDREDFVDSEREGERAEASERTSDDTRGRENGQDTSEIKEVDGSGLPRTISQMLEFDPETRQLRRTNQADLWLSSGEWQDQREDGVMLLYTDIEILDQRESTLFDRREVVFDLQIEAHVIPPIPPTVPNVKVGKILKKTWSYRYIIEKNVFVPIY